MILDFKDKNGNSLSFSEIILKILNRIHNIILEFQIAIVHFIGHIPLHFVRHSIYMILGMRLGKGSVIHTGARFYELSKICIGEDTIIGENITLDGRDLIQIGSHVDIASEVMIYNSEHDINDPRFIAIMSPVNIGDYVFIGPRAIILPGVTIGNGAVIGAGAVVTRDVASLAVVGGVPAKVIGERKIKDFKYRLGRARLFR
ncbi:MAG: acyltransferase [Candidatus Roizmanbacteria bacterium]